MFDKELIALAFEARKLKPWEKFEDDGLFAVRFEENIYVCTVVGQIGEEPMIILNRSMNTWGVWTQMEEEHNEMPYYKRMEEVYSNDAVCCRYSCKAALDTQARLELDAYCKSEKHTVRGVDAWPSFYSMVPYRVPGDIEERDAAMLKTMFKGLIAILKHGLPESRKMLCWDEENITTMKMPEIPEPVYPKLEPLDEFTARRLKKQKKEGSWVAKLVMLTAPVEDEEGAYFPFSLIRADGESGELLNPIVNEKPEKLQVQDLMMNEKCPTEVMVYDDRTFELLDKWMNRIGVSVVMIEEPEKMEDCIDGMMGAFMTDADEIEEMMLEHLGDPEFLEMLPDDMLLEVCREMDEEIPPNLKAEIKRRGLE